MARPLRIEFAGALYRLTSRGDRREAIFLDDADRGNVPDGIRRSLRAPRLGLSRLLPDGQSLPPHRRVGHVFQGRYKAILVQKDTYLLELAHYIVLNPVRAAMVRSAREWPWSSYRATAGEREKPEWLDIDWLLSAFGSRRGAAMQAY